MLCNQQTNQVAPGETHLDLSPPAPTRPRPPESFGRAAGKRPAVSRFPFEMGNGKRETGPRRIGPGRESGNRGLPFRARDVQVFGRAVSETRVSSTRSRISSPLSFSTSNGVLVRDGPDSEAAAVGSVTARVYPPTHVCLAFSAIVLRATEPRFRRARVRPSFFFGNDGPLRV